MTNITEADTFDATIAVPDNGEKVIAVSGTDPPPAGEGPVRPAFQKITNRTKWLWTRLTGAFAGTRVFKQLSLDLTATAGDAIAAPDANTVLRATASGTKSLTYKSTTGLTLDEGGGVFIRLASTSYFDSPLTLNGACSLGMAQPLVGAAVKQTVSGKNVVAVWALVSISNVGVITIDDGHGIAAGSVSLSGNDIVINFLDGFATSTYGAHATLQEASLVNGGFCQIVSKTATQAKIGIWTVGAGRYNPAGGCKFYFSAMGVQ